MFGQSERGNISGIVSDPQRRGRRRRRHQSHQSQHQRDRERSRDESGEYNAPNLSPGTYRIEVTAPGFKRFVQENVIVAAASTLRSDIQLQLGQVSETVEVSASAVVIQTDNAKVSTQVQNKLVDELAARGRRSDAKSVQPCGSCARGKGSGSRLSLGGGQVAAWDATLDGHSVGTNRSSDAAEAALNTPSVESLTEFTVDTNGFKAEYGQAGGGVMTFASKSGTNQFHGSAYDFLRNDAMDARGFFAPSDRSIGKTISVSPRADRCVIPKIYDGRNKTFFFASLKASGIASARTTRFLPFPLPRCTRATSPIGWTRAARQIPIYDPATTRPNPSGSGFIRDVFPNNQIPGNRFAH